MIENGYHLTYCTNIHPGETWEEVFRNLDIFVPRVKNAVAPDSPFGVGLRLSNQASLEILENDNLAAFKAWLAEKNCYVFTFNGFPYGGFHGQVVKDKVHQPDWTTSERLAYTLRLTDILAELLPEGLDGGISTSPISYKYWHEKEALDVVKRESSLNLARAAAHMYKIKMATGKALHLDIEPEPDGVLENTREVISYYSDYLIPQGGQYLQQLLNISGEEAENCIKAHIQICYDVCHFAIVYEKPAYVFAMLAEKNIRIGKIQISAALKSPLTEDPEQKERVANAFSPFVESTYLHQVVEQNNDGSLTHFPDLPAALENLRNSKAKEWRTHFHVPVFLTDYGYLSSTQQDIIDVIEFLKKEKICRQLEVETYTWEVLPKDIQLELSDSIIRELKWLKENVKNN